MPFAILSLDEGVDTGGTTMNVGDTIVDSMTESSESDDGEDSTIVWTEVGSQEELDEALENGEYYGALIVPADYSEKQLAATQAETQAELEEAQALLAAQSQAESPAAAGADASASAAAGTDATGAASATGDTSALSADSGMSTVTTTGETDSEEVEQPVLTMLLDNAKSPMIATQMSTSISSMFSEMGMEVETETIHTGSTSDDEEASSSTTAMGSMASLMLGIMPPFMLAMMSSNFICMGFRTKRGAPKPERWRAFGKEALYALGLSLIVALLACLMMWVVTGISVPMGTFMPFMWITSFCMMMVFIGLGNIAQPLGMFGGMIIMMLGMMSGTLPFECLPTFWQDFIYPWAPQHYVSEGVRAIMYLDGGVWNAGTGPLIIWGIVGMVLSCIGTLIPRKARKIPQDQSGSQDTPASIEAPATA